ncbi:hypothetical protein JB92DRAFT_3134399 [Gautieria morchelliformis]|nr:hypothetical protein JB92DRAFT_3134399 [Gautieria morchelliformis]
MPIELLMWEAHPLHWPARSCARRLVKRHPSSLHQLLHAFHLTPNAYEKIVLALQPPDVAQLFTTEIAPTREESKEDDMNDTTDAKKGIKEATILLDNQAIIQSIGRIRSRPAQHILEHANNMANGVARPTRRCRVKLKVTWISGHDDVEGNEAVDSEARRAAKGDSSPQSELPAYLSPELLPRSVAAARQCFRTEQRQEWRRQWMVSPHFSRLEKIDESLPSKSYCKMTSDLTRAQTQSDHATTDGPRPPQQPSPQNQESHVAPMPGVLIS